jgi:integrase
MKIYFSYKKPKKGDRSSFKIVRTDKHSYGRKYSTVKDSRIVQINVALNKGILTYENAEKQIIQILEEYRNQYNPKRKRIFLDENIDILNKFWKEEYSHRELIDSGTMYRDFKRAISILGTESIVTISQQKLQQLIDTKTSGNKQRRIVTRLRTLLKYIGRNDIKIRKNKKERKRINYLTESDLKTLVRHIENPAMKALVTLAFYSGLRIGEIYALHELSLRNNILNVVYQMDEQGTERETKNRRIRKAYLFDEGVQAFHDWVQSNKSAINRHTVSGFLKSLTFKIFDSPHKNICFHDLRHSYAILCILKGISLSLIAQSLGNSLSVCQEYYAGFTLSDDAIEAIKNIVGRR